MKRNLLRALLVVMMLILLQAITSMVFAAPAAEEDFDFNSSTHTITQYLGTDVNVEIPATIRGVSVKSIGEMAFASCTSLTSVTIPDSVTTIGRSAFELCENLTSITIPDSVTEIGAYAFACCGKLSNITIPNSVTSIEAYTYYQCYALTNITIPNGVKTIATYAFRSCSGLTSVTIPNSVEEIGESAFEFCGSLTSVTIPSGVRKIGESAFSQCRNLTNVTFCGKPGEIGVFAFWDTPDTQAFPRYLNLPETWTGAPEPGENRNFYDGTFTVRKFIETTFDGNGADTEASPKVINEMIGEKYTLPTTEPTRKDYDFVGWYTDRDGGKQITETSIVDSDAQKTLYARWYAKLYKITITNDGNGTATASRESGIFGTDIELTATPTAGYEFDQWKVISGGVTVTDNQFTIGSADVEIKACFKPKVTLADISIVTTPKLEYTEGETLDLTGMVVEAFYSDGTTKTITGYTVTPSGALTTDDTFLTVRYTEGEKTITTKWAITVNPASKDITAGFNFVDDQRKDVTETEVGSTAHLLLYDLSESDLDIATVTLSVTVDGADVGGSVILKAPEFHYTFDQPGVFRFTLLEVGLKDGTCLKVSNQPECGLKVIPKPVKYKVIKGNNLTVFTNAKSAVFASSAPFDKFSHVLLDGEKLAKRYYKAESGSTVITLNENCIKKLSEGKHTLTIVSKDGSVTAKFTVEKAKPKTGDATNPALLLMMLIACAGTIILVSAKAKKSN